MQTNIELASASGQAIRLPVAARRERITVAEERPARPATLSAVMAELKRAERWETMVWVGLAIAAAVLLVMSFFHEPSSRNGATTSSPRPSPPVEEREKTTAAVQGHNTRISNVEAANERKPLTLNPSPHRMGRGEQSQIRRDHVTLASANLASNRSGKKFVADAVDGEQMFGSVPVVAEFFSQLNDDLVEGASRAEVIVTPDVVEQAVPGKNFARMSGEELKELKLFCGKFLDRFTTAQLESFRINCGAADMENIVPVLFGGGGCGGAAEERVNSRKEFADAEGLGDVVVSAEIQSDDFVDFLTFSSKHQDGRRIFFGAELFAYVIPARAGKHDIKDDQGRVTLGYSVDGFVATIADGHVKAVPFHDFFESEEDVRIIFNDENSGFHRVSHADFLSQAGESGSRSVKQLPPPSRGSYTTSPPWARAI